MPTFRASAGTSSGPPFFKDWIAFLISRLVGLPQLMGSSVSAGITSEGGEGDFWGRSLQEFTDVLHLSPSLFLYCWLVC